MLQDQRMEGMLEETAGAGHRGRESYLDTRANTQREIGQKAGPIQRTTGEVSTRRLRTTQMSFHVFKLCSLYVIAN